MTELIVRFITPLVCGYLVFVAISNQLLPWRIPAALQSRPRWLLACCLAATVAISLLLVIHFSFGKSVQEMLVVAPPLGIIFLTMVAGSFLVWLGYRKRCRERVNFTSYTLNSAENHFVSDSTQVESSNHFDESSEPSLNEDLSEEPQEFRALDASDQEFLLSLIHI